jgi:hypothetical protein
MYSWTWKGESIEMSCAVEKDFESEFDGEDEDAIETGIVGKASCAKVVDEPEHRRSVIAQLAR